MTDNKKKLFEILSDEKYGLCPAPMSAGDAIQILTDYLLGEDFYIAMPLPTEQANTIIVTAILKKYSKQYRKDCHSIIRKRYSLQLKDLHIEGSLIKFVFEIKKRPKFRELDINELDAEATQRIKSMVDFEYRDIGCCGWADCCCKTIQKEIVVVENTAKVEDIK